MKVLIVYYSMYGHTFQLARAVEEGARSCQGVEVSIRRVQEVENVEKQIQQSEHARQALEKQKDIPICTVDDLEDADGVIFGSPTRYGNMTAQMKQLIDSTVSLWLSGKM